MFDRFKNLFNKSEKRSAPIGVNSSEIGRILGIDYNGSSVSVESAMNLSAVYACVKVISEGVATPPANVIEVTNGNRQIAKSHPSHKLIHSEPNAWMTSFTFRQAITEIALRWGNGYARIIRGSGQRPVSLKVYPGGSGHLIEAEGELFAQTPDGLIPYYDIFHLRGLGTGIEGKSPIRYAAESMGITMSAQTFGRKFFENGAHVGGVLEHPGKLSDTAFSHLKESFSADSVGVNNVAKPKILEEGMKWSKITLSPDEAQFIQTRQFGLSEICRVFGVPPHMIQDLERATFSNIEHQSIAFVNNCLMPWLVKFEQEANRKLFRDSEKDRFYVKINTNALLRGDTAARALFYKEMFGIGVMSQNMILELEDQNPIEGGDRHYVQGNNMVPIDRIDDVINANTAPKTTKPTGNEGE